MLDIVGAYFLLASGIVANKYALRYMAPDFLVGLRMAVSGLFLMSLSVRRSTRLRWDYLKHDMWTLVGISLGTTLVPALLKAYALSVMAASKQTLLGSVDPFITAIYAYFIWGEQLTIRKLVGMSIGFYGIALSVVDKVPADQWYLFAAPEIAVLIAIALGRYGWMLVQVLLRKGRYQPTEITSVSMLSSGICSLVISVLRGNMLKVPGDIGWQFVSAIVYTTLIGNICGYTAYTYCLQRYDATVVATVGLLVPLFVALLSTVFIAEPLTLRFGFSFLLVALGVSVFYGTPSVHKKNG